MGGTSFRCGGCGAVAPAGVSEWRCASCGGPLELVPRALAADAALAGEGLWRYRDWLPLAAGVSLGEPTTPLVELPSEARGVLGKLEAALPTGSFKDRGSALVASRLRESGARRAVIDSSGNAGASMAAYCARAGIACEVFVPASASPNKLAQIAAYGARIVPVPGDRQAVADAAIAAVGEGAVYASHAWNPYFLAGTQTFAFELWEQLGRRAPQAVVMPVGQGTLLLGTHKGFEALRLAGLLDRPPRLYGVQSAACAPLALAAEAGAGEPVEVSPGPSAAEGIMLARPPRGAAILRAVAASGGGLVAVEDGELWEALRALARSGLYVEPTTAAAAAGLGRLLADGRIAPGEQTVVALTGSGLKASAQIVSGLGLE